LQLFAHPENSEWFSVIPVIIIFEVNIVAERKQAYWQHFFVFSKFFSSALNFFTALPLFRYPWFQTCLTKRLPVCLKLPAMLPHNSLLLAPWSP